MGELLGERHVGHAIQVLQSMEEVERARSRLTSRGWDVRRHRGVALIYSLKNRRRFRPDIRKSWDVSWFAEELVQRLGRDEVVVDVGGVNSELPWALHLAGFRHLHSCDIDSRVLRMPFARHITYHVGGLEELKLERETVSAITAVSTLEHGVAVDTFFEAAARLLRPGGLLCVSTDYWPAKIEVANTMIFGLPWKIYDRRGVQDLIAQARRGGLQPLDGTSDVPEAGDACINFSGRSYTFLGIIFRKAGDTD